MGEKPREFNTVANHHAEIFLSESDIETYFDVNVQLLDDALDGLSLTDPDILDLVVQFGMENMAADRYIGVTTGDLKPNGNTTISGWTYGPDFPGVIVEGDLPEVSAHELGHTFGLCDEYNYSAWVQQNEEIPGSCPNPYPVDCPRELGDMVICFGNPTQDGKNSLMGPAGLPGDYGFNVQSYNHLLKIFGILSSQDIQ